MVVRLLKTSLLGGITLLSVTCGAGAGTNGGSTSLPTAGIIPYVALDEPVLSEPGHDLRRPWILTLETGFRMWVADRDVGSGEGDHLQFHDSQDGWNWSPEGTLALEALSDGWEDGQIGDPCVIQEDGEWLLYYTGGDDAGIGLATSENGLDWVRHPDNPILSPWNEWEQRGGVAHPSVLRDESGWVLFFVGGEGAGVGRATSTDGITWTRTAHTPIFTPSGTGGTSLWDRDAVLHATIVQRVTPTGRTLLQMWYGGARLNAGGDYDIALGIAGSFDGIHWDRFLLAPVLHDGGLGESEAFPLALEETAVLVHTRYWKKEGNNRRVIALAFLEDIPGELRPAPNP